jgi:putative FmdB family regulatory protein
MPIFEYKCKECGTDFEKIIITNKNQEISCPNCGSSNIEKKYSVFGFRSTTESGGSKFVSSSSSSCSGCSATSCTSCNIKG